MALQEGESDPGEVLVRHYAGGILAISVIQHRVLDSEANASARHASVVGVRRK